MPQRVEVATKPHHTDAAGLDIQKRIAHDLGIEIDQARIVRVYTIDAHLADTELQRVSDELLTDPIIEDATVNTPIEIEANWAIEVGYRPGVTDNIGKTAAEGIADTLGRELKDGEAVFTSTRYLLTGELTKDTCEDIASKVLANGLIERWAIVEANAIDKAGLLDVPRVTDKSNTEVQTISLDLDDEALATLSRDMMLALEVDEMNAIKAHYSDPQTIANRKNLGLPQWPTDIELEVIAQTWSEHCKHKIFAAKIEYHDGENAPLNIDGLFKTYVKGTTDEVSERVDWLVSVFHDNAGLIKFGDEHYFALKAETHNSPSALDPYGGAITGIVGVNRDILGAGMGCRCILNTDVFCFAPPEFDGNIPPRLMHPRRILRGVHRGVMDGANQSGIPDVNGAIVFHERFLGKPLVFCGTGGLIPATINGKPTHEKTAHPGDLIVMCGGRIGKDGIHGATFSSEELHEGSPATAVQIGDPITQKKMADFLLEARDLDLFTCITDNGAGGLSSSIGEMAEGPGGAAIHLDRAPLKYAGLAPWEIFLSEAQERMTLAVSPDKLDTFVALAKRRGVEATALGEFTDTGRLECYYEGSLIGALDMDFLHDGVPTMQLTARWSPPTLEPESISEQHDIVRSLIDVLGSLNVCSKETFVRMYDHEVQGASVLKPFQGAENDGPGNAAVIRPIPDSDRGIAISNGICPKFSDLDTYHMMANAIDEAVRNLVCVGADIGTIAGLDNFCWPDPVQSAKTPDGEYKLAQLVRCCQALFDVCTAYDIPLISGKDSMKNDYKIGDTKISIPPTVLFTAAAVLPDVNRVVSMDVKKPGDVVYVLGETKDELGGSEFLTLRGVLGTTPPVVEVEKAKERYTKLASAMAQGLVASCHDCSDGGLGAALAETAFAGGYGLDVDISPLGLESNIVALFSETASRLVVTIPEEHTEAFEGIMADTDIYRIGSVIDEPFLRLSGASGLRSEAPLALLKEAWQRTLRW